MLLRGVGFKAVEVVVGGGFGGAGALLQRLLDEGQNLNLSSHAWSARDEPQCQCQGNVF